MFQEEEKLTRLYQKIKSSSYFLRLHEIFPMAMILESNWKLPKVQAFQRTVVISKTLNFPKK